MYLAVDVGGTKMAAGLVDREGNLTWSASTPTPPGGDQEDVWAVLEQLVARASEQASHDPLLACGVGCGGPMEEGGVRVSPLNIPAWRQFPLRDRLAELTGLPVWVDNDAKALALAEGWTGAAAGLDDYMSMVVSTGIGGGIVLDGRLLGGAAGNAGHIGHLIVEPGGRKCVCGAHGCLEAEASGTSIAAMTGRPAAAAGPEWVARAGMLVGRAVGMVANLLDLRLVTAAGSVALGFGEPFFAAAADEIARTSCLSYSAGCRFIASPLGGSGPLVGAAAVARTAIG